MVYNNFDKKANELLLEFLPLAAPVAVGAGGIGTLVGGIAAGLVAILGTAGIIAQQQQKSGITDKEQLFKRPVETQPTPSEQQPITPSKETPEKTDRPITTPAFRPPQIDVEKNPMTQAYPGTQAAPQAATSSGLPPPVTQTAQAPAGTPQPPRIGAVPPERERQQAGVIPPPISDIPSYRYPYQKQETIEAYPIDRQLGNMNVPGTRTAYRDTFNMPTDQAFDVGLNQPPIQQMTPQGDIPNAPKSLRAKYQHRASNPDEYEGTKAFGGISNLFK